MRTLYLRRMRDYMAKRPRCRVLVALFVGCVFIYLSMTINYEENTLKLAIEALKNYENGRMVEAQAKLNSATTRSEVQSNVNAPAIDTETQEKMKSDSTDTAGKAKLDSPVAHPNVQTDIESPAAGTAVQAKVNSSGTDVENQVNVNSPTPHTEIQVNTTTPVVQTVAPIYEKVVPGGIESLKQYDLRIITMVFDRTMPLLRLLDSINAAEYFKDSIKLEVWIDRAKNGSVAEKVNKTAREFKFKHGDFSVHVHPKHVGLYGQWLDTWTPVENSQEIAMLLEDDTEVSPFFYKYLKAVHKKYDDYPNINGYSLQGFSVRLSSGGGDLRAPYEHPVFLYPVVGSWGFSPSKKNWVEFLKWVKPEIKEGKLTPHVLGTVQSNWYRWHKASMWDMWHTYYSWNHNQSTLYCNLEGHEGFTANWREEGLHFHQGSKGFGARSNSLVTSWKPVFDDLPDKPVLLSFNADIIDY